MIFVLVSRREFCLTFGTQLLNKRLALSTCMSESIQMTTSILVAIMYKIHVGSTDNFVRIIT